MEIRRRFRVCSADRGRASGGAVRLGGLADTLSGLGEVGKCEGAGELRSALWTD